MNCGQLRQKLADTDTTTEIDYEVVRFATEDAVYAAVLWQLPDGRCAMEVWDIGSALCLDPGATTFKKVSATSVKVVARSRDAAIEMAKTMAWERDNER